MRSSARLARGLFASAVTVAVVTAAMQAPAHAHTLYADKYTFVSDTNCTQSRSEISNGLGNNGFIRSDVRARYLLKKPDGDAQCGQNRKRPPGHLAVQQTLFKWTGTDWALCARSEWFYNSTVTAQFGIYSDSGVLPCGQGYYSARTAAWVYDEEWNGGGSWGGTWTGAFMLPAPPDPGQGNQGNQGNQG